MKCVCSNFINDGIEIDNKLLFGEIHELIINKKILNIYHKITYALTQDNRYLEYIPNNIIKTPNFYIKPKVTLYEDKLNISIYLTQSIVSFIPLTYSIPKGILNLYDNKIYFLFTQSDKISKDDIYHNVKMLDMYLKGEIQNNIDQWLKMWILKYII